MAKKIKLDNHECSMYKILFDFQDYLYLVLHARMQPTKDKMKRIPISKLLANLPAAGSIFALSIHM